MTSTDDSSSSPSPSPIPSHVSISVSDSANGSEDIDTEVKDLNYLDLFKDAIGKIKGQKQRPSFERLSQAVKQAQPKTPDAEIERHLSQAIQEGHLFKVFSSGRQSYKDTENLRSLRKFTVKSDADARRAVKAAVREIGEEEGTIEEHIRNYVKFTFSLNHPDSLSALIDKALGHLVAKKYLVQNGKRYQLTSRADEEDGEGGTPPKSIKKSSSVPRSDGSRKKKTLREEASSSAEPTVGPPDNSRPSTSAPSKANSPDRKPPKLFSSSDRAESKLRSPDQLKKKGDKSGSTEKSSGHKSPKLKAFEERSGSKIRTPEEKSKAKTSIEKFKTAVEKIPQPPKLPVEDKLSPSKPKLFTEERTPKFRALLEERSSKLRSPDGMPTYAKTKELAIEQTKTIGKPGLESMQRKLTSPGPALSPIATKKSFQKVSKSVEPKPVPMDQPQSSVSQPKSEVRNRKLITPDAPLVKKKRGRPVKKRISVDMEDSHEDMDHEEDTKSTFKKTGDEAVPDGILDKTFQESIPKELRDGLSKYFTPSLKRKSRVAISTLLPSAVSHRKSSKPKRTDSDESDEDEEGDSEEPKASTSHQHSTKSSASRQQHTAAQPSTSRQQFTTVQKDRVRDVGTEETKHQKKRPLFSRGRSLKPHKRRGKKSGSTQLKSLQDGLSKYFTAAGDRKRRPPTMFTEPPSPTRKDERASSKDQAEPRNRSASSDGRSLKSRSIHTEASQGASMVRRRALGLSKDHEISKGKSKAVSMERPSKSPVQVPKTASPERQKAARKPKTLHVGPGRPRTSSAKPGKLGRPKKSSPTRQNPASPGNKTATSPGRPRKKTDALKTPSPATTVFKVPETIPTDLEELFKKARERALKKIPTVENAYTGPLPPRVQLGDKRIKTWYTSPFPEEYIRCECLYLCEFCLQYMKTLDVLKSHYQKCPWHRPPGTEIYRDTTDVTVDGTDVQQELVIYETDGNEWKEYCQNLCLLAKFYLDHKTLYYDVEPFLFYVLCRRDKYGDHLVGYFSKEKNSPQRYNVSCIMVLPPFQGEGYGRYLIDFSYLLSRVEKQHGTPEKPLSEMGFNSYQAYWRSAVLDFFLDERNKEIAKTSIKAICDATGMWPQDVADTLQGLNFLVKSDETKAWEFSLQPDVLDSYAERKNTGRKRIELKRDKLHWDPWRGEAQNIVSTESERSGSRAEQLCETADDQKDGQNSTASSDSDFDQALDAKPAPPEDGSPAYPSIRRSRTPRGDSETHRSTSREKSLSHQPPSLPVPVKRKQVGRPSKNDFRRRGRGRDGVGGAGPRKKRKGKFRSRPSSSIATTNQPKNYKGRREEFRAGTEKRRKHHTKEDNSGDESDLSSFYMDSRSRRSGESSESSADESLASVATYHPRTTKPFFHKEIGDESSSSSEVSSSRSLSHLDQPPRAPHPPEPVDLMDQGISTDSPAEHFPDPPITAPRNQPEHRVAEICIQTEPVELIPLQPLQPIVEHVQEPRSQKEYQPPVSQSQQIMAEAQTDNLMAQQMVHVQAEIVQSQAPPMVQQQLPLSPPMLHLAQPHTPYHHQQASPHLNSMGSVTNPASVLSMHEAQMAQDDIMMNPSTYDNQVYDQYTTPQHTPGIPATSPGFQSHQQASPAAAQLPYAAAYQESPRSQASVASYDILHAPLTPTTPGSQTAYMNPSPRPVPSQFVENVSSPLAPRHLQTPLPVAQYQDPYVRTTPSIAPFEQTRTSHSVAPTHSHSRAQAHAQAALSAQVQQQQYDAVQEYGYSQKMVQQQQQQQLQHQAQQQQMQLQAEHQVQQQVQAAHAAQAAQHHHHHQHHSHSQPQTSRKSSSSKQRYTEQSVPAAYSQIAANQQSFMFHPSYGGGPGMVMSFPGMQEQHPGYPVGMQQPSDSSLAKLTQLAQGIPGQAIQHPGMAHYGHPNAAAVQRSQGHGRQQHQQLQHQMTSAGMAMQMQGSMPMQYLQKGMQGFPGQSPVMTPGYGPSFFGQGVPMPGQSAQYRPVGAAQPQSMYPAYPYYHGAQHPHAGHHAAMRQ